MDKPKICYVAFLDIMGFANFVKNNTAEHALKYLSNFTIVNNVFDSLTPNISSTVFSDTIAIYTPTLDDLREDTTRYLSFLRYIGALQYQSVTAPNLYGMPLRGAITKGEFYSNNKDILFGKAWVEAYYLEKEKAIYPRVIIKKEAHDMNNFFTSGLNGSPREAPLRLDNGEFHCNYLNSILDDKGGLPKNFSFILDHKKSVEQNLIATKDNNDVNEKYKWLKKYHNWFCSGYEDLKEYMIS